MISFVQKNARWIAGGFLLTFFSAFGQTFFIALSAGDIRAEFGLSHGAFGTLYMVATLASALTLPFLGRIVDRYSTATVALITVPALALGTLGMAFATHIFTLTVSIYLLRLFGQGMMTQNALTATGRWFAANRGRAVSLVVLGHNISEALFPIVFVMVAGLVGWRNSWIIGAAALMVLALPVIMKLVAKEREPQSEEIADTLMDQRQWTRAEVMRDPLFWLLLTGVLAPAFIGTTIFFHQVYLVELKGWSLSVFASSFTVLALTTVCFVLIAGWLIDRYSARHLLPWFLLPLAMSCFALGSIEAQWSAFLFMTLLGISYGFSSTLFGALWPEIYGTQHLGAIRAIVVSLMVFLTAAGPGLTGFFIDRGVDYLFQVMVMGVYCTVISLVMAMVSRLLRERTLPDRAR